MGFGEKTSFILTKWYVNGISYSTFICSTFSFILTKWYVNIFCIINDLVKSNVLY